MKLKEKIKPAINKKLPLDEHREVPGWRIRSQENHLDFKIESKMPSVVASRGEFYKNLVYPHWKLTKGTTYEPATGKKGQEARRLDNSRHSFSLSGLFKPSSEKPMKNFFTVQIKNRDEFNKTDQNIETIDEEVKDAGGKNYLQGGEKFRLVIQRGEEIGCSLNLNPSKPACSNSEKDQKSLKRSESETRKSKLFEKFEWKRTQSLASKFVNLESGGDDCIDYQNETPELPLKENKKNRSSSQTKIIKNSKTFEITTDEKSFKPNVYNPQSETLKLIKSRSNSLRFANNLEKTIKINEKLKYSNIETHPPDKYKGLNILGAKTSLPYLEKNKVGIVLNDFPTVTERFDTPEKSEKKYTTGSIENEVIVKNEVKFESPLNDKESSPDRVSEIFLRTSTDDQQKIQDKIERRSRVVLSMTTFKLPLIVRQSLDQSPDLRDLDNHLNSNETLESPSILAETLPRTGSLTEFKPFSLETPLIEEHPSIEDAESFSESGKNLTSKLDEPPKVVQSQKTSQKNLNRRKHVTIKDENKSVFRNWKKTDLKPIESSGNLLISSESPESFQHFPKIHSNDKDREQEVRLETESESPMLRSLRRTKSLVTNSSLTLIDKKLRSADQKLPKISESNRKLVSLFKSKTAIFDRESSDSGSPSNSVSSETNLVQNTEEQLRPQSTFEKNSAQPLAQTIENPLKNPSIKKPKNIQHRRSQILVPVVPRVREDSESLNPSSLLKAGRNNSQDLNPKKVKFQDLRQSSKLQKTDYQSDLALKKENLLKKVAENKAKPSSNDPSQTESSEPGKPQKKLVLTERQARQRGSIRVEVRDFMPGRKPAVINERPKRKQHKKRSTFNSSAGSSDYGFESVESESPVAKDRNYDKILYELNHLDLLKRKEPSPKLSQDAQSAKIDDLKEEELEKVESSYDSIDVEKEINELTKSKHFSMNNLAFNAPILCKFLPKDELQAVANVNDVEITEFNVDHENLEFYLQKKRFVNNKMLEGQSVQNDFTGTLHILDLEQWPPGELHRLRLRNYEKVRRLKKFIQNKQGSAYLNEQKQSFYQVVEEVKKKGFYLKKKTSFQDKVQGHHKNSLSQQDLNHDERIYARIKGFQEIPKKGNQELSAIQLLKTIRSGMEKLEKIYE